METHTDLAPLIIEDLKAQAYFDLADNGAKTRIRNTLAKKHRVDAVWIKDVVINGYGKQGRRIADTKVTSIFDTSEKVVRIRKISEDPAEGYISFESVNDGVYFVSSAPAQVGTGIMKSINAIKTGVPTALVIINNGNDGPLSDTEFKDIKTTLDKLQILAAAVHSGGISHKIEAFRIESSPMAYKKIPLPYL